ncbi:MAG: ATP-binding protein [Arhodomonas sp.]|nr:ATP-binding protein [Arhodomonas sp.]
MESVLRQTSLLLGGRPARGERRAIVPFDMGLLNANRDLAGLRDGLVERQVGSLCFYGPPGTGKTAFARHLADCMGREVIVRRASTILGSYVGETERAIAEMFTEAADNDAVLVLDEADSFLGDRRGAHQQWEVTQVNELLTQMEAFEGVHRHHQPQGEPGRGEPAALRPEAAFRPVAPGAAAAAVRRHPPRPGRRGRCRGYADRLRQLDALTPGDFEAVAQRLRLLGGMVDAARLYRELEDELAEKGAQTRPVGFTARL